MTEILTAAEIKALKRHWYNRWKDGFEWLTMAETLRATANNIRGTFLAAEQRFFQDIYENAEIKIDEDTIHIKRNFAPVPPDPEMDMYRVYMGQAGYAIENLLKGIIISGMWLDDPKSIDDVDDFRNLSFPLKKSTDKPKSMKTHDIVNNLLDAKNLNLTFEPEEEKVMRKLTHFIKWGGRYTSPVVYDENDEPTFMKTI
jgi:hypothetical protein